MPRATASRAACAFVFTSVRSASKGELRSAAVCLINRIRASKGLPRLQESSHLDWVAQGHSNSMVSGDYFGHGNTAGRIGSVMNWGAYGEAISTGYRTPWRAVWGWMASTEHCQILLSPTYDYIGIGVNRHGVAGWTNRRGTWTADLARPLGWGVPSGNFGPANGCPY